MGAVVVTRAKRRVVGAHYGTAQWLRQRLTAVIMAVYTVLAIVALLILHPENHAEWRGRLAPGGGGGGPRGFFFCRCYHPGVGLRDLHKDYFRPTTLRLALYTAVVVALGGYAAWAVQIMWRG